MFCDELHRWDRVKGGREVQGGGDTCIHIVIHFIVQQKLNIVKQLYSNKKFLEENKETLALNDTLKQVRLYRCHPKAAEYTFFSNAHGPFSRIDDMLGHKISFNKFKKNEIHIKHFFLTIML